MSKRKINVVLVSILVVLLILNSTVLAMAAPAKIKGPKKDPGLGVTELAKQYILEWLDQENVQKYFAEMNDAIWSYAELGLEEYKTADLVEYVLAKEGFKIERGVAGMPTALTATYGSGKPVIAILGELDALPMISQKQYATTHDPVVEGGPGHGCTHNTMATAGAAAAIAVKRAMDEYNIKGTVRFYGSPAEETLISRPYMVDAGLFDDVDAVIDNHGGGSFGSSYGISGTAMYSFLVTFTGKTGHAASPWTGRSALDGVELMNIGTNFLREHLHFSTRMHYVIIEGGEAPNVMPDKATVWYFIRSNDDMLDEIFQKVLDCAKGAAIMSGTEYEVKILTGIHQSYKNKVLAETYQKNIERVGMPEWTEEEQNFVKELQKQLGYSQTGLRTEVSKLGGPPAVFTGGGSTDVGTVSLYRPTASISFPSGASVDSHHWTVVAVTGTSIAHKGLIAGAKAMALSAIDLLTVPEILEAAWEEFNEMQKEHPFFSRLPEGAKPPVGFYEEEMKKYRPLMEKFYQEPSWYPDRKK